MVSFSPLVGLFQLLLILGVGLLLGSSLPLIGSAICMSCYGKSNARYLLYFACVFIMIISLFLGSLGMVISFLRPLIDVHANCCSSSSYFFGSQLSAIVDGAVDLNSHNVTDFYYNEDFLLKHIAGDSAPAIVALRYSLQSMNDFNPSSLDFSVWK